MSTNTIASARKGMTDAEELIPALVALVADREYAKSSIPRSRFKNSADLAAITEFADATIDTLSPPAAVLTALTSIVTAQIDAEIAAESAKAARAAAIAAAKRGELPTPSAVTSDFDDLDGEDD
ncbi:hypothetical protein [Gordonia sp. NPDC003422]